MSESLPHFAVLFDGKEYDAEVARVENFHIGAEDHGVWTALVRFTGVGWAQGLPPIGLDEYDSVTKKRHTSDGAADYLARLIGTIGSPEQAAGRRVVIFREEPYGDIKGCAALNDDGTYSKPFWNRFAGDKTP